MFPKITCTGAIVGSRAEALKADEVTVLRVAESLEKTGKLQRAVQLLESTVKSKDARGALYLVLAGYYDRLGEHEKAAQAQHCGQSLMRPAS